MAERVAKQYNFKILQLNVEVKLAHNEIVKVIGITERLEGRRNRPKVYGGNVCVAKRRL